MNRAALLSLVYIEKTTQEQTQEILINDVLFCTNTHFYPMTVEFCMSHSLHLTIYSRVVF